MVTCWERADLLDLLSVIFSCVFVSFPYGVLCKVWYLIVSIPDLCLLPDFMHKKGFITSGPGLEVIKLFSYSNQMSTKFILLINVKMPTIVGILTFIRMIITTSERLKARNVFVCGYFSFHEQLEFRAQLS